MEAARVGSRPPCDSANERQQRTEKINSASAARLLLVLRAGAGRSRFLDPLGEKPELIDARRAYFVHDGDNRAVLGPGIALNIDGFIQLVGDQILNLPRNLRLGNFVSTEEDVVIASDGDDDGIVFVRIFHFTRISDGGHIHRSALLQHWSDDHEDDEQHEHDIRHRYNVRGRYLCSCLWLKGHLLFPSSGYFLAPRRRMK